MRIGQVVKAKTIRGVQRDGEYMGKVETTKGDWFRIKPTDPAFPEYKTRPVMVEE